MLYFISGSVYFFSMPGIFSDYFHSISKRPCCDLLHVPQGFKPISSFQSRWEREKVTSSETSVVGFLQMKAEKSVVSPPSVSCKRALSRILILSWGLPFLFASPHSCFLHMMVWGTYLLSCFNPYSQCPRELSSACHPQLTDGQWMHRCRLMVWLCLGDKDLSSFYASCLPNLEPKSHVLSYHCHKGWLIISCWLLPAIFWPLLPPWNHGVIIMDNELITAM